MDWPGEQCFCWRSYTDLVHKISCYRISFFGDFADRVSHLSSDTGGCHGVCGQSRSCCHFLSNENSWQSVLVHLDCISCVCYCGVLFFSDLCWLTAFSPCMFVCAIRACNVVRHPMISVSAILFNAESVVNVHKYFVVCPVLLPPVSSSSEWNVVCHIFIDVRFYWKGIYLFRDPWLAVYGMLFLSFFPTV